MKMTSRQKKIRKPRRSLLPCRCRKGKRGRRTRARRRERTTSLRGESSSIWTKRTS